MSLIRWLNQMKQNKWTPEGGRPQLCSGPSNCYVFSSSETFTEMPKQGTVGTWRRLQGAMRARLCPYEGHAVYSAHTVCAVVAVQQHWGQG